MTEPGNGDGYRISYRICQKGALIAGEANVV